MLDDPPAERVGVVLKGFQAGGQVLPGGPDQVVAPDLVDPVIVHPLHGAQGSGAVLLPLRPLQVIFQNHAVEVVEDELPVFRVVGIGTEEDGGGHSGTPAKGMPLHLDPHFGGGNWVAVQIRDSDGEVALADLVDTILGRCPPGGVSRGAVIEGIDSKVGGFHARAVVVERDAAHLGNLNELAHPEIDVKAAEAIVLGHAEDEADLLPFRTEDKRDGGGFCVVGTGPLDIEDQGALPARGFHAADPEGGEHGVFLLHGRVGQGTNAKIPRAGGKDRSSQSEGFSKGLAVNGDSVHAPTADIGLREAKHA